jgi:hypothetical protein
MFSQCCLLHAISWSTLVQLGKEQAHDGIESVRLETNKLHNVPVDNLNPQHLLCPQRLVLWKSIAHCHGNNTNKQGEYKPGYHAGFSRPLIAKSNVQASDCAAVVPSQGHLHLRLIMKHITSRVVTWVVIIPSWVPHEWSWVPHEWSYYYPHEWSRDRGFPQSLIRSFTWGHLPETGRGQIFCQPGQSRWWPNNS